MSLVVYAPLMLWPGFQGEGFPIEIVDGVELVSFAEKPEWFRPSDRSMGFSANAAIRIHCERYEAAAAERLKDKPPTRSMKLGPRRVGDRDVELGTYASGVEIANWALTSLILCRPFAFVYGQVFRCAVHADGTEAVSTTHRRHNEGVREFRARALPDPASMTIELGTITAIATAIEVYFRPFALRPDRIAVALRSLWTSMCTPYPEHAYTSLSVSVEALLSSSDVEITHQLAERAAFLLADSPEDALATYRLVKRLYGTRSNIVHGRGMSKSERTKVLKRLRKGQYPGAADTAAFIHPGHVLVPQEDLRLLTGLAVRLIQGAILDDPFRHVLQQGTDEELDAFFLNVIFGVGAGPADAELGSAAAQGKRD